ncbi:MAG: RAMP superfamily CRISPR-associated protein [Eubacteriales bacterium]|nr:RAMP superfamily CRISPR-associated protein [Eubacteriales bacterium]
MAGLIYDKILRYQVTVQCNGPLRIGNAVGSKEEVLIHPVDHKPFVQASSIAGALKNYYRSLPETNADALFGSAADEDESRVKISDGIFLDNEKFPLKLELRPHVKINRLTGSVDAAKVQGTNEKAGQKFNIEYIGTGSAFTFTFDVYEIAKNDLKTEVNKIFAGLRDGAVQFGGKKSSGAGNVSLTELKYKAFDLKNAGERKSWIDIEDREPDYEDYIARLPKDNVSSYLYRVVVSGKTEGSVQVKGIAVSDFGKNAPDSENIKNAKEEYIIPGSSFKGTVRSQMEKIAEYMGAQTVIEDTFGVSGKKNTDGRAGNIIFYDTIIGDKKVNEEMAIAHRIHIDKFTGGVFNKGLFSEKNAVGKVEFMIDIKDRNNPDATLGILLLAMRDMAIGMMSVGNGFSTGKGMIAVENISIEKGGDAAKAVLNFKDGKKIDDPGNLISSALSALKGGVSK